MTINGMKLLEYVRDNDGIPLTKSGAFYRKCVEWAAVEFEWPGFTTDYLYRLNKVLNEPDVLPLYVMHELFDAAKLLRRYKGKAKLTKSGMAAIGNHGALQTVLFEAYFTKVVFEEYERYPLPFEHPDYQHFFGVVNNRTHDWVSMAEFSGWCLPIDAMPSSRFGPMHDASMFLYLRLIRPLKWLGLIEEKRLDGRLSSPDKTLVRKTKLFDQFLRIANIRNGPVLVQ